LQNNSASKERGGLLRALKKYSEAVFIAVLFLYGCAALWQSYGITGMQQPGEFLTPKMYVVILGGIFVILCLVNIVFSVLQSKKNEAVSEHREEEKNDEPKWGVMVRTAIMIALGFLFVIGMKVTGFYIAAFLVVVIGYLTIEGRTKKDILTAVVFALIMCVIFYLVFRQFHIYLPKYMLQDLL